MCGESYLSEWQRFNKKEYGKNTKIFHSFTEHFNIQNFLLDKSGLERHMRNCVFPLKGRGNYLFF